MRNDVLQRRSHFAKLPNSDQEQNLNLTRTSRRSKSEPISHSCLARYTRMLVDVLNTIGKQRIFEKDHAIDENQDPLTREDLFQTSQAPK